MLATLPILMALSWVPAANVPIPAAPLKTAQPAAGAETIKCPLTGEQIPSCCCPAKN